MFAKGANLQMERAMNIIYKTAAASAVALSAFAFVAMAGSAAEAAPARHPGSYCLEDNHGGSDCSFKTYAQCQASASGTDAECFVNVFRRDDSDI